MEGEASCLLWTERSRWGQGAADLCSLLEVTERSIWGLRPPMGYVRSSHTLSVTKEQFSRYCSLPLAAGAALTGRGGHASAHNSRALGYVFLHPVCCKREPLSEWDQSGRAAPHNLAAAWPALADRQLRLPRERKIIIMNNNNE